MKLKELKTGVMFNIENTPSYPKLKTDKGYVCMRDEIINNNGNCNDFEVKEMTQEDIDIQFPDDTLDNKEWVKYIKNKYLGDDVK